jgi:DNA-binding transcriptional LysR family regulator
VDEINRFRSTPVEPDADINPRLLRTFLAVADERHFGRAAARLGIAQPAVSRQVQQLEHLLGVALLNRNARGVSLTDAGRLVLPEARAALRQYQRILRTARTAATRGAQTLAVTAPLPSPPGGLLAEAVRRFRRRHDGARLTVVELTDGEQLTALADGRVDALLTWGEPAGDHVVSEALVDEQTAALLPRWHPRADERQIAIDAIAGEPFLFPTHERAHCWERLRSAGSRARVLLDAVPTAPATVLDLVGAGLGVSAVPASFRLIAHQGVTLVPLIGLSTRMTLAWRADETSPLVQSFVESCRTAANALVASHGDMWTTAHPT